MGVRRWSCGVGGATLLVLWLAAVRTAGAEEGSSDPAAAPRVATLAEVAAGVHEAWRAGDDAVLQSLAAAEHPDPWRIVDLLLEEGHAEVAAGFADRTTGIDVEALPRAARAAPESRTPPAARSAWREARAAESPEAALPLVEGLVPGRDVLGVEVLALRAAARRGLRRMEEAAADLDAAVALAEEIGWIRRASEILDRTSKAAYEAQAYGPALRLAERAAACYARRGRPGDEAWMRLRVTRCATAQADLRKAREQGRAALALYEGLEDREGIAMVLLNLATERIQSGDYDEAHAMFERGLALAREMDHPRLVADLSANLGVLELDTGALEDAEQHLEAALAYYEGNGNEGAVGLVLGNLGNLCVMREDYPRALAYQERALALKRKHGDHRGAAATLLNVGVVRRILGEADEALAAFRESLAAARRLGDPSAEGTALANLAHTQALAGRFAEALALYEDALQIYRSRGLRRQASDLLLNLGHLYGSMGDRVRAREAIEQALAETKAMGDRAGSALALQNLGALAYEGGDLGEAAKRFRAVLALEGKGAEPSTLTFARSNLGIIAADRGRFDEAEELLAEAVGDLRARGESDGLVSALCELGDVHFKRGDYAKAKALLEEALEEAVRFGRPAEIPTIHAAIAWNLLYLGDPTGAAHRVREALRGIEANARGLGEEQGALARTDRSEAAALGVRAAVGLRDGDLALAFLEQGRGGSLVEALHARTALRQRTVPAELREAEARAQGTLGVARSRQEEARRTEDRRAARAAAKEVAAAEAGLRAVVDRIRREAKGAASLLYATEPDPGAIRAGLAEDEALVMYSLPEDLPATAVVATREGSRLVTLGPTVLIEMLVAKALKRWSDPDSALEPAEASLGEIAGALTRPLGLPEGVRKVLVSPDGALAVVPFPALLPDRAVALVDSATTYALLRDEPRPAGQGVLAAGDPAYARGGPAPLPETRIEVEAVGDVRLLGKDATVARLREALGSRGRWRAVHLACHGLFDTNAPAQTALALAPDGTDPGTWHVLDVFEATVPADLVVLSACQTGRGKVVRGEGVVGLPRAFHFAGAPRVLCSLWKVDDAATRALMLRFYALWNPEEGSAARGAADALRAAQAEVRADPRWRHPRFWAAWTLWGLP